ncbi:MarR family transcriptional regulator [Deinococcus sp. Arct2-2]|uniref:MarR family winged helix-turn-helix transcriptional regulator n=1 Tax=Deinococcus sp. Arct2-2 TaxID=2568653 RepID=UPI00197AF49F|nr:MarR family transcriptional regulator [Deinococcus sp. Arct2-2]
MNAARVAPETAPEALPDTLLTMLQDLRLTLSVLNRSVGQHFSVNEVDLDCLDILSRHGPHAPSQLAQRMGLHLATMTGVLDRLERGGWVVRERSLSDRRRVLVRADPVQSQRITEHYAHAAQELRELCAVYPEPDLRVVIDFLRRVTGVQVRPTEKETAQAVGPERDE